MLFRKIGTIILALITTITIAFATNVEDAAITTEVKAKLLQERDIPKNIKVTTQNGIVRLEGKTDTHLQAHRAVEIASSVNKVVDVVDNELKVKDSKSIITDALITAKVKGKISQLYMQSKIEPSYDLHVETTNQVVHVFGSVNHPRDIDVITSAIKKVRGVKDIKTNINS